MSDFTHTLSVTIVLDDGRVIQANNSYVIPGVLFVAQQSGILSAVSPASTPPVEPSDFFIAEGSGGYNPIDLENGNGNTYSVVLAQGDVLIIHGPAFFEQDTNASTATNAGVYAGISFYSQAGYPSYMLLNNTAS